MKPHELKYILTADTITIYHNTKTLSIHRTQAGERLWNQSLDALRSGDVDRLVRYADPSGSLVVYSGGLAEVKNGQLYVNDVLVDTYPAQKAVEFMRLDLPFEPVVRFIERLEANPSYRARQELYGFLEYGQLPLTHDGHFIAYKKVVRDETDPSKLVDIYTRTMDNSPGVEVTMPRNHVDEDSARTCSRGLHVCSHSYLANYGTGGADAVISVKIDPADVVAVPQDYNNTKMRVCRYEVLEIIEEYDRDPLTDSPLIDLLARPEADGPADDGEWTDWPGEPARNADGSLREDEQKPDNLTNDTYVNVQFRNGNDAIARVDEFDWSLGGYTSFDDEWQREHPLDILRYRVVDEDRNDESDDEWVEWNGDVPNNTTTPFGRDTARASDVFVEIVYRNGERGRNLAYDLDWTWGNPLSGAAMSPRDIMHYRVVDDE